MLNLLRPGTVFAIAGLGLLAGCSSSSPPPAPAAAAGMSAPLTVQTPIATIVANPAGKAVLDKDFPGLTTNSNYGFIKFMTLKSLEPMSGGKITDAQLQQAQTDLSQVPPAAP